MLAPGRFDVNQNKQNVLICPIHDLSHNENGAKLEKCRKHTNESPFNKNTCLFIGIWQHIHRHV